MCGIAGFFDKTNILNEEQLHLYNNAQKRRGPDGNGTFFKVTPTGNIGLGHVRLSILDLSDLGKQPMFYEYLSIILNGEIYNFKTIQSELVQLGYPFESNSDTEVVLKAFHAWGLKCVEKFRGMFAFAIYDSNNAKLYLSRDRVGVKPLYYSLKNGQFVFGSELKVFFHTQNYQAKINKNSLRTFINYGYVTHPYTILDGVKKADVGSWTIFDTNSLSLEVENYWNYSKLYEKEKFAGTFDEAVAETEQIAQEACELRMVSDVPVGVFLSGGFDSTLVTALLQKDRTDKLKTFTIGFSDGLDESKNAEKIAKHLGTDHTSYDCKPKDAKDLISLLPELYDDPISDISCIPTMLVSKLARQEVKVALSADGGDELFGGYGDFKTTPEFLKHIEKVPFKKLVGSFSKIIAPLFSGDLNHINKKIIGIGDVLLADNEMRISKLHFHQLSLPSEILNNLLIGNSELLFLNSNRTSLINHLDSLFILSVDDVLRDYLLVKVDRATMGFSLEGREPLLDHKLIEFAASLPFNFKHDGDRSKRPIKEIVYKYVPKQIMDRPKIGFDLPIYKWLRSDLSYLIDEFLNENAIKQSNLFNYPYVKKITELFNDKKLRYENLIWRILIIQMWYKRWFLDKK
jgi:asparagine synthase (glutamine-hydrolysing)